MLPNTQVLKKILKMVPVVLLSQPAVSSIWVINKSFPTVNHAMNKLMLDWSYICSETSLSKTLTQG